MRIIGLMLCITDLDPALKTALVRHNGETEGPPFNIGERAVKARVANSALETLYHSGPDYDVSL